MLRTSNNGKLHGDQTTQPYHEWNWRISDDVITHCVIIVVCSCCLYKMDAFEEMFWLVRR